MITEEMLCAAAARSCEIYVSYLERGYTPENQHEFSLQFEKKIKKLKRKADHPVFYHATKRIASIVLAILITGGVWIAVDAEARAAFVGWVYALPRRALESTQTRVSLPRLRRCDRNGDQRGRQPLYGAGRPVLFSEGAQEKSHLSPLRYAAMVCGQSGQADRLGEDRRIRMGL